MIRGLYVAASGLLSHARMHEIHSANIVNQNSPGYRGRRAVLGDFQRRWLYRLEQDGGRPAAPVGSVGSGPLLTEVALDDRQGPLRQTGRPLDVALEGPGFFSVETEEGIRYTRAGDFRRDAGGRLVTAEGYPVMGDAGVLVLPEPEEAVRIDHDGSVWRVAEDGGESYLGRLQVVVFPDPDGLERSIAGTFAATVRSGNPAAAQDFVMHQGFLEGANVGPAEAMIGLMASLRAYEASQRAIQSQNEWLRRVAEELARP